VIRYVLGTIGQAIVVLLLFSMGLFGLLRAIPGDPAVILAGPEAGPEVVDAIRRELALDQPIPIQYLAWAKATMRGDFGQSFVYREPVVETLGRAVFPTLEILIASMFIGTVLGLVLGVLAASYARKWPDVVIGAITATVIGIPVFWAGLLGILLFSLALGWLPSGGFVDIREDFAAGLKSLALPAGMLGLSLSGPLARFVRSAMLETLGTQYVRTARAKGVPESRVVISHALRNAWIPVLTVLGIQFGRLLGGAVVVEAVFGWPGLGQIVLQGVLSRDYPIVQGTLLFLTLGVILVNLAADLSLGFADPRLRR
jgi:peptide/nickel transport system permease protein